MAQIFAKYMHNVIIIMNEEINIVGHKVVNIIMVWGAGSCFLVTRLFTNFGGIDAAYLKKKYISVVHHYI